MSNHMSFVLVGVGGAGGRIVNEVANATDGRIPAIAIDTDFGAVSQLGSCQQVRIAANQFNGAGSGGDYASARNAAETDLESIRKALIDASLAVVVAGLGGGTGSGITSVVLRIARELNIRTLVFTIMPFSFESDDRRAIATRVHHTIENAADVACLVANDTLCCDAAALPVEKAFSEATAFLADGILLLWRMANMPGYIQLDTETLLHVIERGRGKAIFARAAAQGGHRLETVMADLLDHSRRGIRKQLASSPAALVGIVAGPDLRLQEVGDAVNQIRDAAGKPGEHTILMGTVVNPSLEGRLAVVVLVFTNWKAEAPGTNQEPIRHADVSFVTPAEVMASSPLNLPHTGILTKGKSGASDRFGEGAVTLYNNTNLDVPTFIRQNVLID